MARHCVRWASGRKKARRRSRASGRHCKFGKVKRGRRKGQCLKSRRPRTSSIRRQEAAMWAAYGR